MNRPIVRTAIIGVFGALIGIAIAAGIVAWIPDPGSAPSIFDDFQWNSTANGFWHVNAAGASATIKDSTLTLKGSSIELDRRLQTDPYETVVSTRIRGISLHRMGLGLGVWHAGTIGMEFDDDGVKCGRASDYGYRVDVMRTWTSPPSGQWFYLEMRVGNPYPDPTKIPKIDDRLLKRVRLTCLIYDQHGKLLARDVALRPPPNTHYVGLDEAYVRTWDNNNDYQLDWFYSGPESGNPLNGIVPAGKQR